MGYHQRNDEHIIAVPEGEESEEGIECFFKEIMDDNVPCLGGIWISKFIKLIDYLKIQLKVIFCNTHNQDRKSVV